MKIEVTHLYPASQSFTGFLLGHPQQINMEPPAVQQSRNPEHGQERENSAGTCDIEADPGPAPAGWFRIRPGSGLR
jgi:hypothetical protein